MWPFSQRIISDEWQRKEKLLVDHQVLSHVSSQDLLLLHSQCSSFILCSLPGLFFIFVIPLCLNSFLLWKLFLFFCPVCGSLVVKKGNHDSMEILLEKLPAIRWCVKIDIKISIQRIFFISRPRFGNTTSNSYSFPLQFTAKANR